MRTPLPDPKPNPFRCPIRTPKPRDCAWCAHRADCPRRADDLTRRNR
ncbi:MAG: hypothetical protein KH706_07500 [Faecalibacterium prausnitzii]|nr:hypothetical protein [Faecalibacterium prausnitzii]